MSPISFFRLDLRTKDAKKHVQFLPLEERGTSYLCDEMVSMEDLFEMRPAVAKDGYGRGGGDLVGDKSSISLTERSVAVYASARTGKVASEPIEPCDVCLGCGLKLILEGMRGVPGNELSP